MSRKMLKSIFGSLALAILLASCAPQAGPEADTDAAATESKPAATEAVSDAGPVNASSVNGDSAEGARVTAVEVNGDEASGYTFAVTVESPDEGCERYANWWEVVTEEGDLLYRRILVHSHVDEQPFTRSGGPVIIGADEMVLVRSHMQPTGYSTQVMKGSIASGFESTSLPADFASELAEAAPLPSGCGF
ncbi:MAG: hypothetical protein WA883_17005 [Phormidesmis sp.]